MPRSALAIVLLLTTTECASLAGSTCKPAQIGSTAPLESLGPVPMRDLLMNAAAVSWGGPLDVAPFPFTAMVARDEKAAFVLLVDREFSVRSASEACIVDGDPKHLLFIRLLRSTSDAPRVQVNVPSRFESRGVVLTLKRDPGWVVDQVEPFRRGLD